MSSKTKSNIFYTFAFKLTVWYAVIFSALMGIIFLTSFNILSKSSKNVTDYELSTAADNMEYEFKKVGLANIKGVINNVDDVKDGETHKN